MKKAGLEFKVGLFVILAIAFLVAMVVKAGDYKLKPGYKISLVFNSVSGVETGSPIRLAGVEVGDVRDIHVMRDESGETKVEVIAWISQGVNIEEDSKLRVATLGFLGDKYIEILPGSATAPILAEGGMLSGKTTYAMDDILSSGQRLIGKMENTVDNINEVVTDEKFKNSVRGTFTNAEEVGKNLSEASADIKEAAASAKIVLGRLRDGQGTVGKLLKDDKVAKDLEAFVADIKAHPWKLLKKN